MVKKNKPSLYNFLKDFKKDFKEAWVSVYPIRDTVPV